MQGHFEVRNPEVEAKLKELGEKLKASMPKGFGFALLIANYGPGGGMFYASNFHREDVCDMMRDFIAKHEAN